MTLLIALLALNAVLHALIISRFGARENMPPLVFGVLYAVLAIALYAGVPYALWAALIVPVVGTLGLTAAYGKITHERTIEKLILMLNPVVIAYVVYLLFWASPGMPAAA